MKKINLSRFEEFTVTSNFENILDMGCGCGVFGLFLNEYLKIHKKSITNLVFSDIDQIALNSAYVNYNLNR